MHTCTDGSSVGQSPGPIQVLDCVPFEHFCATTHDDHSLQVPTVDASKYGKYKTEDSCLM